MCILAMEIYSYYLDLMYATENIFYYFFLNKVPVKTFVKLILLLRSAYLNVYNALSTKCMAQDA